jgi:hypothetical protein
VDQCIWNTRDSGRIFVDFIGMYTLFEEYCFVWKPKVLLD